MQPPLLKKQTNRVIILIAILCGLFTSFSLQAATVPIIKGTAIIVPSCSPGDTIVVTGNALVTNDWAALRMLNTTTPYHLSVLTPNPLIPVNGFLNCTNILSVNFPVATTVGDRAFSGCTGITSVSFPEATSIGNSTFFNCDGLTSVSFPKVTSLGITAFSDCNNLVSVSFPEVISINNNAFNGCNNLTAASFPKATSIAPRIFFNCTNLLSASFPKLNYIDSQVFSGCTKLTTTFFPELDSIGSDAFRNCAALTSVTFPKVISIGTSAFTGCNILASVFFPEATLIGHSAFRTCIGLTLASFPKVTSIVDQGFYGCTGLVSVSFPELTSVGHSAFRGCTSLANVSFPNVTSIADFGLYSCTSLTIVSFPELTSIGTSAFRICTNLIVGFLPELRSIGPQAFDGCSRLSGFVLGYPPSPVGTNAFNGVSALLLVVPDSTAYTPTVLSDYPTGTEAYIRIVSTEYGAFAAGSGLALIPNRIPALTGGFFRWEKDGIPIAGATASTYHATSDGHYTSYYERDGLAVMLKSIYVVANPYDLYGIYNRYQECENTLELSFTPSTVSHTVEVWSEGTGSAYVFDVSTGRYFKNKLTYKLSAGDSVLTIPYGIDENVKDASKVTFACQVSGGTIKRTDILTLYAEPEITLLKYYPTSLKFKGILDISITNGSYYIQRSLDHGHTWQFARDTVSGRVLPFSQIQIANFVPGDSILFRQPNGCRYDTLVVGSKHGSYPDITRSVTIPSVTDVITSLQPGDHVLWSTDDFTFTITPTGTNLGKELHISTSRTSVPDSEGVSVVKNQDGSFTVTIHRVQEAVIVTIDFATGIESITGNAIWSHADRINIRSEKTGEASIYTISGSLVGKVPTGSGETVALPLSNGLYVVRLHGKTYKIMIHN